MPTYEYACKSCGQHLELQQSFTDDALTTCPTCGGSLRKVFGNIAISFKGSGFYSTDNRSVGKAGGAGGGADGAPKPEAAGDSKSDSGSGSDSSKSAAAEGSSKLESKPEGGSSKPDGGSSKSESGSGTSGSGEKSKAAAS